MNKPRALPSVINCTVSFGYLATAVFNASLSFSSAIGVIGRPGICRIVTLTTTRLSLSMVRAWRNVCVLLISCTKRSLLLSSRFSSTETKASGKLKRAPEISAAWLCGRIETRPNKASAKRRLLIKFQVKDALNRHRGFDGGLRLVVEDFDVINAECENIAHFRI